MNITIRRFEENDIPFKVRWINDPRNNRYLHYDLPLSEDKTRAWFNTLTLRTNRADYTIICEGELAGLIGLLNIDPKNKKAEYYICVDHDFKGMGIGRKATDMLIRESAEVFGLKKIVLYTETENIAAQRLFEKIGFEKEGLLKNDLIHNGRSIDRFVYGLDIDRYLRERQGV